MSKKVKKNAHFVNKFSLFCQFYLISPIFKPYAPIKTEVIKAFGIGIEYPVTIKNGISNINS